MSYELEFKTSALKEWRKLDSPIREQFKKRLAERLEVPHVASAKLSGLPDCYKVKLRDVGYRLVYQVVDDLLLVVVIAVGRRDHDQVYRLARGRV
jgi:mRNA interferase RelE/StbE